MRDPLLRFSEWLERARAVDRALLPEPTAFSLATVSAEGRPSVRMLLLKGLSSAGGFVFYTNLHSRKGSELAGNAAAAMCFHWQPLELQVRVEGSVSLVGDAEADEYFATRPRESQIGAWASMQSSRIETDGDLQRRFQEMTARFEGIAVPRPPHWSGFTLSPRVIEFWEGRPFRLHLREVYTRTGSEWEMHTLYP
jgi:pyridoxamine 5'-phosphate oxidase